VEAGEEKEMKERSLKKKARGEEKENTRRKKRKYRMKGG
jgi:hypothetical protein